jgi:DNA-binding transcriptional LysR family regulator
MNHVQIACFLAAAKAKSFSAAADSMYMSPPTFGRQISSLEQELGFPLFQRGWKKNQLTPAGTIMFEGFSKMTAEYNLLVSRAMEADAGLTGKLTLGLLEGQLVDTELRNVLQAFGTRFPKVNLELQRFSFHDMLEALENAKLDAGITLTVELMNHPELSTLPLYALDNELVLAESNTLTKKEGVSLADFSEETFIEIEQSDSSIISGLMRASCKRAGFAPKIHKVSDLKAQITAVELGRGIAAFNCYHQTCNYPGLAHIAVPELPAVEFSLVWDKTSANPLLPYLVTEFQNYFHFLQ